MIIVDGKPVSVFALNERKSDARKIEDAWRAAESGLTFEAWLRKQGK